MSKLKQMAMLALVVLGIAAFAPSAQAKPENPTYVTNIVDVANARLVVPKGEYTGLVVTLTNSTLTIDSPIAVGGDGGITVNGDVTIIGGSNTAVVVKEVIAPKCSNIVIRATKDVTIEKNLMAWGSITVVGDSVTATGMEATAQIRATEGDVRITATGDNAPLNVSRYTVEAADGNVFLDAGGDIDLVLAKLNAKDEAGNDITKGNIMLSAGGHVQATGEKAEETGSTFRADRDLELRALGVEGVGLYNYSYAESKHGSIRLVAENASGTAPMTIGSGSSIEALEGNVYLYGDIATIGSGTDDEKGAAYIEAAAGDVLVQSVRGSVTVASYLAGNNVTILANKNTSAKSDKGAVVFEGEYASVNASDGSILVKTETGDIDINDGAALYAYNWYSILLWAKDGSVAAKSGKGKVECPKVAIAAKGVTGVEIVADDVLKDNIEIDDNLDPYASGRKAYYYVYESDGGRDAFVDAVIDFTIERTVVEDAVEFESIKICMAKPATENGGAFCVATNGTLAVTYGFVKANRTMKKGGAIYNEGTVNLAGCTEDGRYCYVEFYENEAEEGGAIYNAKDATVNLNGSVYLDTDGDTVINCGTLNWNLWADRYGYLYGYQNLANASESAKLQLTVGNYATTTNFTIASGDFSDMAGKDKFAITNAVNGDCGELWIGAPIKQLDEESSVGYQLVVEAGGYTSYLVLKVLPLSTRIVVDNGDTTNLVDTAVAVMPGASFGGAVVLGDAGGGTLNAKGVTFEGNTAKRQGGAIYISDKQGTVNLEDVTFKGNKADLSGGAIQNGGTVNLNGDVTLVTTNDTLRNIGTLNWNLTGGKAGCLNGFEMLESTPDSKRVLTVEDYPVMPTNFVIATAGSDESFAVIEDGVVLTNVTEEVSGVIRLGDPLVQIGNCGYKLVAEDARAHWWDEEAWNLVLKVYDLSDLTDRIVVEAGDVATNLVSGTVYTAMPTDENGGAVYVEYGGKLTGESVTFANNEAYDGGAIHSSGTVAFTNVTFAGNKAGHYSAAIYNYHGEFTIVHGLFTGNGPSSAELIYNSGATMTLNDVTFDGNETYAAIWNGSGKINLDGPVTLASSKEEIYNHSGSTLNWNLTGETTGCLNGYEYIDNRGKLLLTVKDYDGPREFVIATGVSKYVKGEFQITNVTGQVTATIAVGGIALLNGTWWELATVDDTLVLRQPEMVKITDVPVIDSDTGATNATAVVTVDGNELEPNANGSYTVPAGCPVTLVYTAQGDYMFAAGLKEKKVNLGALVSNTSMDKTGLKPAAETEWADVRTIDIDTRERIVVADPNEVLPLAYSTNNWGAVKNGKLTTVTCMIEGKDSLLVQTNTNGYVEWTPKFGKYGKYELVQCWFDGVSLWSIGYTNAFVCYSQPYALTVQQSAGGKITATANTADVEMGTVLGYDFVDVEVTPYEGYSFKGWSVRDAETGILITNVTELTGRFEMPNEDAVLSAEFVKLTGVTVNGIDIVEAEGEGWSYDGKTLTIATDDGTATNRFEIGGMGPNGMAIVAKNGSQFGETATLVLNNFTNDVLLAENTAALKLTGKAWRVELAGENYLAAGSDESAVVIEAAKAEFTTNALDAAGMLVAVPGASTTILPGVKGNAIITGGTYSSTVDPALATDGANRRLGFSNGDGTWTVKDMVWVMFQNVDDVICAKGESIPAAIWPKNPTQEGMAFNCWTNDTGDACYPDEAKFITDTDLYVKWDKNYKATYVDEKGEEQLAKNVNIALGHVPEGGTVVATNEVINGTVVTKPVVIVGSKSKGINVELWPGLAVAYSTNEVNNTVMAVVGTNVVTEAGESVVVEKPLLTEVVGYAEEAPIAKKVWEQATNAIASIQSPNMTDLIGTDAIEKALEKATEDDVALVSEVNLRVAPVSAETNALNQLTSFTADIKPAMTIYGVKDGMATNALLAVTNQYLSGEAITVTLNMPEGFVPMFITHLRKSGPEYFLHPSLPLEGDEQYFIYDAVNNTVTFEVSEFSTFIISSTVLNRYAVLMDANGGYFDGDVAKTTKTVNEYIVQGVYRYLETPVHANAEATFDGWYYGTKKVANGDAFAVKGDHTLTAKWIVPEPPAQDEFIVMFDVQGHGEAPVAQVVKKGECAKQPADPVADGWTFGGWFTEEACENAYDFATKVMRDFTLYAKWTEKPVGTRYVAFATNAVDVVEGDECEIEVVGGSSDRSSSVTLAFVKGTYSSRPTVTVDGEKAKFPITLNWARGDVAAKKIVVTTKKSSKAEADKFFTLQLSGPAGIEMGATPVATVTVKDATQPAPAATGYVRALVWPANGGKVSGSGTLKNSNSKLTLKASAKSYATFAGWYKAMANDVNQIDTNALVTIEKSFKVGAGSEYGAGTYYAYFTDVLPVAAVIDPNEKSEQTTGIDYYDGEYVLTAGVKVAIPIGIEDKSGKGTLSVSALPSGLKYNKKTGLIEGIAKSAGEKSVKVVAKNAAGKQTVYYTFVVEKLPDNAIGTWNGVVRSIDDLDDLTHAGFGTVQFTASKAGALSAKVTTRVTGTKSFSTKGYTLIDKNTLGVAMENTSGERLMAVLSLTNSWNEAQLVGAVTGGKFEANDEECYFSAIRNAFDKKTGEAEALELLNEYKGTYGDTLSECDDSLWELRIDVDPENHRPPKRRRVYLGTIGSAVGSVSFKVQDGGKVLVKVKSENGDYSSNCAGAFRITPHGLGAVQTAVRNGKRLWAADALLEKGKGGVTGLACDYDANGKDTHEVIGVPEKE